SNVSVAVSGHTDSVGADSYNQQLSERRANAVRDVLIADGVAGDRLTATGYGASMPVASNADAAGRAQNRRVELTPSE
ncbi:MAG TPA: OmpA family protein, partial [Polyangia bacterium]|nr:OmpA family protein [Polyangia bacterium]